MRYIHLVFLLCFALSSYALKNTIDILSLPEAEQLAIRTSPELQQFRAKANALHEQSVADGQLSDPQLMLGANNVPTNTFSLVQDDMTMLTVGVQQAFPRGHSLKMKSKQTQSLADAEYQKSQEQEAALLRSVRDVWLDIYYWQHAEKIISENQTLYQQLLKNIRSQYRVGKGNQSDVLQAQVDYSRLKDQRLQIQQRIALLQAQLARFVGETEAKRPLSSTIPHWLNPPSLEIMQEKLRQHPVLRIDLANIQAAHNQVAYAKEQYKPGWVVGVGYGFREGTYEDGSGMTRSNMVTAQLTLDLPIFTSNRQDRTLRASTYQLEAAQLERDAHYKDLIKALSEQYNTWRYLSEREQWYREHLYPEAKQNVKAAMLAYRSTTTGMPTVLRAYSNALTIQLEHLQITVERAKSRAALLYFEGVTQ